MSPHQESASLSQEVLTEYLFQNKRKLTQHEYEEFWKVLKPHYAAPEDEYIFWKAGIEVDKRVIAVAGENNPR